MHELLQSCIVPDWPAHARVGCLVTTRASGDAKDAAVRANLAAILPAAPVWLRQVHGTGVVDAAAVDPDKAPQADAAITRAPGVACAVMTADCMPVLLAAREGGVVGVAHAGWRGLCAGVIERTIEAMDVPGGELLAYLGPAIGARVYEVGPEVRKAFVARDARSASAFTPTRPGHWLLDLYAVARQRLDAAGVRSVHGGDRCTFSEPASFFSFRRDGSSGRMAALVWLR